LSKFAIRQIVAGILVATPRDGVDHKDAFFQEHPQDDDHASAVAGGQYRTVVEELRLYMTYRAMDEKAPFDAYDLTPLQMAYDKGERFFFGVTIDDTGIVADQQRPWCWRAIGTCACCACCPN
jgi:hypothetical protein